MSSAQAATIRSTIPARLDRLNLSPFHTRMVAGLGAAWILDGLQITISSSVTGELTKPATLGMIDAEGKSLEDITKPLTAADEPAPASAPAVTPV